MAQEAALLLPCPFSGVQASFTMNMARALDHKWKGTWRQKHLIPNPKLDLTSHVLHQQKRSEKICQSVAVMRCISLLAARQQVLQIPSPGQCHLWLLHMPLPQTPSYRCRRSARPGDADSQAGSRLWRESWLGLVSFNPHQLPELVEGWTDERAGNKGERNDSSWHQQFQERWRANNKMQQNWALEWLKTRCSGTAARTPPRRPKLPVGNSGDHRGKDATTNFKVTAPVSRGWFC